MNRNELQTALEAIATSRRGQHPDPDELLAYHLGECSPQEAEGIEEHLTFCTECSRHVLDMAHFLNGEMSEHVEPVNDFQVARLSRAVADKRRDQNIPFFKTLAFSRGIAALFFVCSAALAGYIVSRPENGVEGLAVANVSIFEIAPATARSAHEMIDLKVEQPAAMLVFPLARTDAFPRYRLTIRDTSDRVYFRQSDLRRTDQGLLTIVVSRDVLPRGDYQAVIDGVTSVGEGHELSRFEFRWRPE